MKRTVVCLTAALLMVMGCATADPAMDAPMMASPSIAEVAMSTGMHNTLVAALKAAGLADMLMQSGNYTVFAPTDTAFAKLPPGTVEMLLRPENKDKLVSVLQYHVVPGRVN